MERALPTPDMIAAARQGLEWRKAHGLGSIPSMARAGALAAGKAPSEAAVRAMAAAVAPTVELDAEGVPTVEAVEFALLGGKAAVAWATKLLAPPPPPAPAVLDLGVVMDDAVLGRVVKAFGHDDVKAGRILARRNEARLRAALDELHAVLAELGVETDDTTDTDTGKGAEVEPPEAFTITLDEFKAMVRPALPAIRGGSRPGRD